MWSVPPSQEVKVMHVHTISTETTLLSGKAGGSVYALDDGLLLPYMLILTATNKS